MLDLRRLRLLREVRLRGTLAAVAEALSFSPSSISQQLALLEAETGVKLLTRSGRRVVLTPEAELLVAHTGELLEGMERMEADLERSRATVSGTVRMAVFQSAALAILPQALSLLEEEHPGLRVELTQREPENALFEVWTRDFDLVIAEEYPGHSAIHHDGLHREPLCSDELRLGVPTGSGIGSIAQAGTRPWVMEPRGAASRHWAEQACRLAGFEPDVRFETADLQAHVRLVESGHAVAILPDLLWVARAPHLDLIGTPGSPSRTIFTAVREASRGRPSIVACRDALLRAVADV